MIKSQDVVVWNDNGLYLLFSALQGEDINVNAQEYKICSEEIKTLIENEQFREAAEIADTIDWTRVRSVTTLCTISDLYKINRRYKDAKILLEQAYDRYPNGRMIVYSLCEL